MSDANDNSGSAAPAASNRQPVLLLRNQRYPTYQLYAAAGFGQASPDVVLKIAILETFNWLRQRFRAFELPPDLDWPDASHYAEVDSRDFKTFLLNEGYKVEVVWLPDSKIWALQLTEPDLGPQPGTDHQIRCPVPGRLYETNIAYRVLGDQVICGFRTIVAEPEGTNEDSEVYRLAVIKSMARNPLVGLRQNWPITDEPQALDTVGAIRRLEKWLRDDNRTLPAVIAVETVMPSPDIKNLPTVNELINSAAMTRQARFDGFTLPAPTPEPPIQTSIAGQYAVNMPDLARAQIGYAIFFVLPARLIKSFRHITQLQADPGEIIVCEAKSFGSEVHRFAPAVKSKDLDQLTGFIYAYPKKKHMRFEEAVFLADARIRYQELLVSLSKSKAEVMREMQRTAEAKGQLHNNALADLRELIRLRDEKICRLNEKITSLQIAGQDHQRELREARQQHLTDLEIKEQEIIHLKGLLDRPKLPSEVRVWVDRNFSGRLIFHSRACDLMNSVPPGEVDLPLLCDALEYLAVEYRDSLLGRIDEARHNSSCSKKYGRPFTVTPIDDATIEHYAKDYKIKYKIGYAGKPVETPLNLHLKVGKTNEKLLRIYFLYDKDEKLIVVGSLPRHLRTNSYH